ncbi:chromosome partitioning protein, ParB family [Chitinophaga ginsengisegetis]|uniref:Chromosome partitioning protein, ParB family n=1 Tax=Chitinophaga ginsengisegetis TaxID=393003 RepID=A0A1T5NHD8_9BACT|nr:ParB/RepB/Spo0J family partition protein [Chitinophaga ginsengisegetis]MDR6569637.1 ParB family chromosome partitioning protein [Chitinophaga ginsengisegetis]MDR6649370.1 ParB family chromosome partitioning protein [Chitinophaga ginsengisegetis]MDR6655720.1 ParB family chromosome partitioning protein [Chitinophaga ginsengisegetis]SKC99990.1 chromosome partitioning protein, ParB family [Chitinophaga ginsengisegetis]
MTNPSKKEALGKGIRSLLQNIDTDLKQTAGALGDKVVAAATGIERISLDLIATNPKQPRRDFDEVSLQELSQSIKLHDVIQPITVSRISAKKFQLIAGERRLRASKLAGLKDIPAYIRQVNDQELLELALLENLQRENLNAIEVGLSYKRLMDECSLTQEQVADRMGKERSTVTNYIRLLKLPPDIQVAVRNGQLSMGHARVLTGVENVENQLFLYNEILKNGLSVRQTEELARNINQADKNHQQKAAKAKLPPAFQKIQDKLATHFSTKVKLDRGKSGKGSILIEFYSDEELDSILEKIDIYGG